MKNDIFVLQAEKGRIADTIDQVKKIEDKKNQLLAEYNQISTADKASIATLLPDHLDFVRLISQIDTIARGYGIAIIEVSAKEIAIDRSESVSEVVPPPLFNTGRVTMVFKGDYEKYSNLIRDIEKSLRIIDVRNVSIKTETEASGQFEFKVEFDTYWLPEATLTSK
jgi:Tfp pilus assembly protein PilO